MSTRAQVAKAREGEIVKPGALSRTECRVVSTVVNRGAMPDVVVIRVPKEEQLSAKLSESPPPTPPPFTVLARFRRVLGLPLRLARALLARLWRRLFGPRPKP